MDRRSFVHTLGAALVGPTVACAMPRAGAATSRRLNRVGLQLYTLRDAARVNLEQTLAEIAAIGYKDVELLMSMNNFNTPPAQVRAMLDRHGLRAPSTHIGENNLAQLDRAADEARILGHRYLILANLPDDARNDRYDLKERAALTTWLETETPDFALYVRSHLVMPDGSRASTLHGVVGDAEHAASSVGRNYLGRRASRRNRFGARLARTRDDKQ